MECAPFHDASLRYLSSDDDPLMWKHNPSCHLPRGTSPSSAEPLSAHLRLLQPPQSPPHMETIMDTTTLFISASPLPGRTFTHGLHSQHAKSKARRTKTFMSTGPGRGNTPPPSEGNAGLGRFREFTSREGDAALQDALEREVLWQATRVTTTQTLETTIQDELKAVSDLLADMYSRSDRDMSSRNEELAIRTSLPNISKWNQQLIKGSKMSKSKRSEISKELEVVEVMLRRNQRARGRRRRRTSTASRGRAGESSTYVLEDEAVKLATRPANMLFTFAVCVTALQWFERIAATHSGPSHLVNSAALSSFVLLTGAYIRAMRRQLDEA